MGNDQKPIYPQLLELPPNLTAAQFQQLVADRIRDLNLLIQQFAINPGVVDLSMGSFRITNLADPTDDLDAVNLRTLRRGAAGTVTTPVTSSGAGGAYAIVSEFSTTLGDGDVAPAYVVGMDRVGSPEETWIYAESAPLTPCAINWQVQLGGSGAFQTLLSADLVLPAGSLGPVFSTALALRGVFPHGTVVKMVATTGGAAGGVSMAVVIKR